MVPARGGLGLVAETGNLDFWEGAGAGAVTGNAWANDPSQGVEVDCGWVWMCVWIRGMMIGVIGIWSASLLLDVGYVVIIVVIAAEVVLLFN